MKKVDAADVLEILVGLMLVSPLVAALLMFATICVAVIVLIVYGLWVLLFGN